MNNRKISWEIVLAGVSFIGIAIFLMNQNSTTEHWHQSAGFSHPEPPSLREAPFPNTFVIDLQNLENLKNLKNLSHLKNLKNLEIQLENIDKLAKEKLNSAEIESTVNQSLEKLEKELQKIENADFKVKLQDRKVYINKDYNITEGAWSKVSPGVYVFQESFSIAEMESMDLSLEFGNINVVGTEGQTGEITIRATGEVNNTAHFGENLKISKQFNPPDAAIKLYTPGESKVAERLNLEATLSIPQNIRVQAKTSGGHITANHLSNDKDFKTMGGHITLSMVDGRTRAKTQGGHITGDNINGDVSLETAGGHIKIQKGNGFLSVKTGGGHIDISELTGSVDAKTSGGNISATLLKTEGPLKFSTSAGNVKLLIPEQTPADLDISGTSVKLDDAFNLNGTSNKGSINGTINGGGIPIVINCEYGNVNIASNEKE